MEAPTPRAGRPELEDWSVESEIGSGGCGTVYVVRNRHTGDRAALKVPTSWNDDGGTAAEIAALASVKHQHIVDLVGTLRTDQGDAILMEYLPGGSVADLIAARGPLSLGEAVTVMAPIAGALAYLHDQGGVHGDVSPGNVLFTAAGMPKLADLGLTVLVGGRQSASGTPGFHAPVSEGADAGGKRLRPSRDVFSLAALTWYMVTGRVAGPTRQRPPLSSLLGSVPSELVELLEDGLSEDEERRPSAAEFSRRIFEVAKPQPVSLRDVVRPEALPHMVTRVVRNQQPAPGRNPWARLRAWAGGRRPEKRSRQGRPRDTTTHRWGSARIWLAALSVALLAGLVALGIGVLDRLQAPDPVTSAGNTQREERPTAPPADGPRRAEKSAAASANATHAPRPVLENKAFREAVPKDPVQAAKVLTARRDLALAAADAAALRRVHARRGSSLGPDLAKASQLRSQGLRYEGLRTRLSDAAVSTGTVGDTVDVVVTSTLGAYQVVGADGAVVASIDDQENQRVTLRLARSNSSWLIAAVLDASETVKKKS